MYNFTLLATTVACMLLLAAQMATIDFKLVYYGAALLYGGLALNALHY